MNWRGYLIALAAVVICGNGPVFGQGPAPEPNKFEAMTKDMKRVQGVWTMYHNDQRLLVDLSPMAMGKEYIVVTSISKGVSYGDVLGGMSWGFGDDMIWAFRKVGDKIHILRRNVRFKANPGSPESEAVKLAYNDSVIYALPVLTTSPSGGNLVDMTSIFMSDDLQIGSSIGFGARFAGDRSTFGKIRSFDHNIELAVNAVYAGFTNLDTVADPRGMQVGVHYSINDLEPATSGYQPRKADDRVGYFLTAVKNFSDRSDAEHFIRYINRWDLRKKDPSAEVSPPVKPIRFYMEKTVPVSLRPVVKSGILEWNRAFEKLGFDGAIEVLQQEESDTWDPEDRNYNTFRWITANAGFAMGPSRVDPRTGQILDADIIFDADFLDYWKQSYETFNQQTAAALVPNFSGENQVPQILPNARCRYTEGMEHQMGFAAAVLMSRDLTLAKGELPKEFIHQGLKEVVMHEVGHTLGLRHNFKASSWKTMAEINDKAKGLAEGTVASVMDYAPPNIAAKGQPQGLYYTQTIGPYDYWAIEYGYKAGISDEDLAKIAARSHEPGLDYATDEDTRGSIDSDPLVNRFDLGKDALTYIQQQMQVVSELMPGLLEKSVQEGDGYQKARQAFGMLFREYWRSAMFASRFPGGIQVNRDHRSEKGRAPFQVVDAVTQRAAMKLIAEKAFTSPTYDPKLLNYLGVSRWMHWGVDMPFRLDVNIHDMVGAVQSQMLSQMLSPLTLQRMLDNELKVAADQDAYTVAEHIRLVVESVFGEWMNAGATGEYNNRKPYVTSYRRNLQRAAVAQLGRMVNTGFGAPADARTLARMHLRQLDGHLTTLLQSSTLKLDDYSKAHLQDCQALIKKYLEAELGLSTAN